MCGIAGFCRFPQNWEKNIRRMNARMRDRGPDSAGTWHLADGSVVFGHTRLAVLDLSFGGSQPMESASGRYCIVLNGEVYNHPELKKRLSGCFFKGTSDTEVLLEYIDRYGIQKSLEDAEGMFAFGIYDRDKRLVYLARDRMGEKPLYYTIKNGGLVFASHLNALMAHEALKKEIDADVLNHLFTHKYIPAPWTIYKGIYKLEPGMVLTYSPEYAGVAKEKYWDLTAVARAGIRKRETGCYEEAAEGLDSLIRQAVKKQMTADVPVGVFLSGGIDSTLVAAVMQELSEGRVKTFTIGFPGKDFNEAEYARQSARFLGTDHQELYVTQEQLADVIPQLPNMYGEPFADTSAISTYLVSRMARRDVTVVLSGDAGDELFCGYDSYKILYRLWKKSERFPERMKSLLNRLPAGWPEWGWACKARMLFAARSMPALYEELHYRDPLVNKYSLSRNRVHTRGTDYIRHGLYGGVEDLMMMDLLNYLPDDILVKVDRAAMACSLETRIPLLDKDIVEYALSLPLAYKWDGARQKRILKEVLYHYVPKELMERPKHGFEVPVQNWLANGPLKEWAEELLRYGARTCAEYLDVSSVNRAWKVFQSKGKWVENIWYVLVFLQWHQKIYESTG